MEGKLINTNLRHGLEQAPSQTLFTRLYDRCDIQRPGRKDKVCADDSRDGAGEAKRPIRCAWDDDREQEASNGRPDRACDCIYSSIRGVPRKEKAYGPTR